MNAIGPRIFLILKFQVMTRLLHWRKRLVERVWLSRGNDRLMVNIGGGLFFRPGWKVLDHVSPFYPFSSRYIDFDVDLMGDGSLPFADDSVAFIYSAHTLEHIPQDKCVHWLAEIHRCLRAGGAVRIAVPDYDIMREAVENDDEAFFASYTARGMCHEVAVAQKIATSVIETASAEQIRKDYRDMSAEEFADHYTAIASREVQKDKAGYHINWFNYDKLAATLRDSGFTRIYRSHPQGSRFKELRGEGGWLTLGDRLEIKRLLGIDTSHPEESLFVEALK